MHKKGAISIDANLRILAGKRSGLEALAGLRLLRRGTTERTSVDSDLTPSMIIR